jgi:hypothetical protein
MGASHSAPSTPNFCTDPIFGKYLATSDHSQPVSSYPAHKHLLKLDFPKFNGDNPKIWAKKCEVYFDVFSIPESVHTRYTMLNFTDRAALWLETIEVSGHIEDWAILCQVVFNHWGMDQHHIFMRQILPLKQSWSVAEYIEKFGNLRHQLLLHHPSTSNVFCGSFLEGLKEENHSVVPIHRPQDIDMVCALALMQEEEVESGKRKSVLKSEHYSSKSSWKATRFVEIGKDHR